MSSYEGCPECSYYELYEGIKLDFLIPDVARHAKLTISEVEKIFKGIMHCYQTASIITIHWHGTQPNISFITYQVINRLMKERYPDHKIRQVEDYPDYGSKYGDRFEPDEFSRVSMEHVKSFLKDTKYKWLMSPE